MGGTKNRHLENTAKACPPFSLGLDTLTVHKDLTLSHFGTIHR